MDCNVRIIILAALASAFLAGCDTDGSNPLTNPAPLAPEIATTVMALPDLPSPEDFVNEVDNHYLAFERGKVFIYEGETEEGSERIVVEVTRRTKTILGVRTTVVHDQAFLNGALVEDTFDWYAQDSDGIVWYFGEDTKELGEHGEVVSTEGSWEAGVNGALPGIIMLANPRVGDRYQQEFAEDVAEDMASVHSLSATVEVPYGTFEGCLQTLEWTPLEPGAREYKYYAPGVGQVLEESAGAGSDRIELKEIQD